MTCEDKLLDKKHLLLANSNRPHSSKRQDVHRCSCELLFPSQAKRIRHLWRGSRRLASFSSNNSKTVRAFPILGESWSAKRLLALYSLVGDFCWAEAKEEWPLTSAEPTPGSISSLQIAMDYFWAWFAPSNFASLTMAICSVPSILDTIYESFTY